MKRKTMIFLLLLALFGAVVLPSLAAPLTVPVAKIDQLNALKGEVVSYPAGKLFEDNCCGADDRGTPAATISGFGLATATDNLPGDTVAFAGGNLTVNGDGSLSISNPTMTGLFVFFYRLENADGHDDTTVEVDITQKPVAVRDEFHFLYSVNQTTPPMNGLFANNGFGADVRGVPLATITGFGGHDAPGGPDSNAPGSTVPFAGGNLKINADGTWSLLGKPFTPGNHVFNYVLTNASGSSTTFVNFYIEAAPTAKHDSIDTTINVDKTFPAGTLFMDSGLGEDDLGYPVADIVSFGGGDLPGTVTDNAAGSTVAFAGGTLTINADGSLRINNPTTTGKYVTKYRLENIRGHDDGTITIDISGKPTAVKDAYVFPATANLFIAAGDGLFVDNGSGPDDLGYPVGDLVSYGGGSIPGTVADNPAGAETDLAGGKLIVNADGSWQLTGAPFDNGNYTFNYQLQNVGGISETTVSLQIQGKPDPADDALEAVMGVNYSLPAGGLFADNGSGPDDRGTPLANLASFGGGDLAGDATTNAAGASVPFAGGTLTVNANGSLTLTNPSAAGNHEFDYRLTNSSGSADATVTLFVAKTPAAKNDAYSFLATANQTVAAGAGLFQNNGSGPDDRGLPQGNIVSFGGFALGGTVDSNAAGDEVALAGGKLTVFGDGGWNLVDGPFDPGSYQFSYKLQNSAGSSTANVTLTVQSKPFAQNDALEGKTEGMMTFPAGTLFLNNGSGADQLGFPVASLISFGGNDAGGTVTSYTPGTKVAFAGGTLLVNANGSLTLDSPMETGMKSFQYRIDNPLGSSDAVVTIEITEGPVVYNIYLPSFAR